MSGTSRPTAERRPSCAAALLGAGAGRRAGGPKALRLVRGRPWWCWQVEALGRCVGGPSVLVWPDGEGLACAPPGVRIVQGPPADQPMFASLRVALAALRPAELASGLFVLPIDVPAPRLQVWRRLAAVGRRAAVPTHRARAGHPVWLSAGLVDELRAADPATTRLDRVLANLGPACVRVPFEARIDAAVLVNLNSAEAWRALETDDAEGLPQRGDRERLGE